MIQLTTLLATGPIDAPRPAGSIPPLAADFALALGQLLAPATSPLVPGAAAEMSAIGRQMPAAGGKDLPVGDVPRADAGTAFLLPDDEIARPAFEMIGQRIDLTTPAVDDATVAGKALPELAGTAGTAPATGKPKAAVRIRAESASENHARSDAVAMPTSLPVTEAGKERNADPASVDAKPRERRAKRPASDLPHSAPSIAVEPVPVPAAPVTARVAPRYEPQQTETLPLGMAASTPEIHAAPGVASADEPVLAAAVPATARPASLNDRKAETPSPGMTLSVREPHASPLRTPSAAQPPADSAVAREPVDPAAARLARRADADDAAATLRPAIVSETAQASVIRLPIASTPTRPLQPSEPPVALPAERPAARAVTAVSRPVTTGPKPQPVILAGPTAQPAGQAFAAAIFAAEHSGPVKRNDGSLDPVGALPLSGYTAPAQQAPTAIHATAQAHGAPLDTRRDDWMGQMIERIEMIRDEGGAREARIRLAPDALGKVDVAIRHDGDGVHVQLTADTPAARTLLADAAPRLAEMAESRGLKLGGTGVDSGNPQAQPDGRDPRQPAAPLRPRGPATADRGLPETSDERVA
ncbi:flagellar hook-length control protein FliK [Sphingomonas sp. DT-204]|uniref:flagellar hook-length control protein FliK n=1 Tax=Sphingomonas sp. DT-204 TaxID=3396166 RepID=UPI003F53F601